MSVQEHIEETLQLALSPTHLQVENESHMHNVPENAETHFKLVVVSEAFTGLRAVQCHQKVYALLSDELAAGVHALAIHTYTPERWKAEGQAPDSPACLG